MKTTNVYIIKTLSLIVVLLVMVSCGSAARISDPNVDPNNNQNTDSDFSSLTIVDNGAVSSTYYVTTIQIDASGALYYKSDLITWSGGQGAATIDQEFTVQLTADEFSELENFITSAGLDAQQDVDIPTGVDSCVGASSIDFTYESAAAVQNTFSISGAVRCYDNTYLPQALLDLLDQADQLVESYETN